MTRPIEFEVQEVDRSSGARRSTMTVGDYVIETPIFMPVGTQAALRSLPPIFLDEIKPEIVLANTYHLHQRPGEALIEKMGGLHAFAAIEQCMLTDSGGFQVFSLDKKQVSEEGVTFAYELDGKKTFLSPERSMEIQMALGADIAMMFDECLPAEADEATVAQSIELTARWGERSLRAHTKRDQSLFGIVQGGMFGELRKRSARQITNLGFDGYAIGGLSVGEGPELMNAVLSDTTPLLPADLPRYLMGVGRPQDLVDGVAQGVDMFDCVIPTRHARSGTLYTFQGRIRATHKRYRRDGYPIDTTCSCYTCRTFTRAYLYHLFSVGEVLATTLCTIHNLTFFRELMARMRASISDGSFASFRRDIKDLYPERSEAAGGIAEADEEKKKKARTRQAQARASTRGRGAKGQVRPRRDARRGGARKKRR